MSVAWFIREGPGVQIGHCKLDQSEARHARDSRRLQTGDAVVLFDGRGAEGHGHIISSGRGGVVIDIVTIRRQPRPRPRLTLAVAAPRGPRQDVLVEKCTELGVAALWPLRCQRSVALPSDGRLEKWRRTAVQACKQCRRAWIPEIEAPLDVRTVLARGATFDRRWVADRGGSTAGTSCNADSSILAVIGPEGGLTADELHAAEAAGFERVGLGAGVLRVETAAIAVAARTGIY